MQTPALVIGHQYDLIHPFSDAGMLVSELPNGRLLEASSLLELRVAPRRLTGEIAAFVDECWRPRAARNARSRRPKSQHSAATLTPPVCRVAKRKRNAASASARSARPPRARPPRVASACRSSSAACSAVLIVAGVAALVVGVFGGSGGSDEPATEVAAGGAGDPRAAGVRPQEGRGGRGLHARRTRRTRARATRRRTSRRPTTSTNPPTSGNHFPELVPGRRSTTPGDTPELGKLVHTLEHGRIDVQYKPGTPATTVAQLETLFNEIDDGYHMLLFENTTKMPFAVAATAWDH